MQLIKGTLDVLVLKALARDALHGFEIACWIEDRSSGHLAVDDGALYQALHRMEERALVSAEWGVTENNRRARYYRMTARGAGASQGRIGVARAIRAFRHGDPVAERTA